MLARTVESEKERWMAVYKEEECELYSLIRKQSEITVTVGCHRKGCSGE